MTWYQYILLVSINISTKFPYVQEWHCCLIDNNTKRNSDRIVQLMKLQKAVTFLWRQRYVAKAKVLRQYHKQHQRLIYFLFFTQVNLEITNITSYRFNQYPQLHSPLCWFISNVLSKIISTFVFLPCIHQLTGAHVVDNVSNIHLSCIQTKM